MEQGKERGRQFSLRRTLIVGLDVVLVFLVLLISAGVMILTYRTEQQTWSSRRLDAAVNAANTVNNFLDRVQGYLSIVGRMSPDLLRSDPSQLENFLFQDPALLEIVRLDAQGNMIAVVDRGEAVLTNLFSLPQSPWFFSAEAGEPYYGHVEISAQNQPYMLVAVPAESDGVVAARLDMNIIWSVVSNISFGESGRVYVVDRATDEIIAYPESEISLSRTVIRNRPQEAAKTFGDAAWQGSYVSLEGDRVLGSAIPVPDKNWTVFAEVSQAEAYSNTRRGALYLVILFAIFSSAIVYVSNHFLNRTLFNPIDELRLGAEKIGAGNLDYKINPQSYVELSELGTAFNDMADKLDRRETALREARDQAMSANRFKGQILAHVSHDLRTPINAIMGYSELLKEGMDGPLNKAQKSNAERIYANSRRLLSLVNSLLDQARLEKGTFKLDYTYFAPKKFAEVIRLATESLAQAKGLEFESQVDPDCPEIIRGDFERTQQVAINLLDNAIKFTESGKVSLHVFTPDANYWAFSISDTGPGIAPENQSIIFQAFRQLDELATRKHSGVGLGLAIVQHLTQAMNGKVWVESEIGKGSRFTVLLPFDPEKE